MKIPSSNEQEKQIIGYINKMFKGTFEFKHRKNKFVNNDFEKLHPRPFKKLGDK